MEFEKLQNIIAEGLNVEADEITLNTTFVDDLGADGIQVATRFITTEECDADILSYHSEKYGRSNVGFWNGRK